MGGLPKLWVLVAFCAAACAPTGGPGRPSWSAGAWPSPGQTAPSPAEPAPALAIVPPQPAPPAGAMAIVPPQPAGPVAVVPPETAAPAGAVAQAPVTAPLTLAAPAPARYADPRPGCPCPPVVVQAVASAPVFRLGGALLRTTDEDVITIARDTPLIRRETGNGPAYCTGPGGWGSVTRSGRDVCLYDRDSDNLLDSFVILGATELLFYETGPFPYPPGQS